MKKIAAVRPQFRFPASPFHDFVAEHTDFCGFKLEQFQNWNSFKEPSENHPQICILSRFEFCTQDGGGTLRETANANVAPMLRPDIIMDRD